MRKVHTVINLVQVISLQNQEYQQLLKTILIIVIIRFQKNQLLGNYLMKGKYYHLFLIIMLLISSNQEQIIFESEQLNT